MFKADLQNDTLFLSEGKSAMNYWRILNCAYKSALSSCIVCATIKMLDFIEEFRCSELNTMQK